MTFTTEVTIPLMKDIKTQDPTAICQVVPNNNSRMVMVHSAMVPRGGSFATGCAGVAAKGAAGSTVAAAFPRSEVGFITSTLSVYQQEALR